MLCCVVLCCAESIPMVCDSSRQDSEVMDVDALCRAFHSAGYKDQTFSHNKIYTKRRTKKGQFSSISLPRLWISTFK